MYSNTNILSDIDIKNENIKLINSLYSNNIIYNLIEKLNEIQGIVKISTHSCILFMTSLLKFSDTYFGNIDNINNSNKCYCENISREIKSVDVSKNIEKKSISNTLCNENIKIRINNALALANKEMLKKVKNNWNLLDDYLYDEEYSVVAGLLKDSLVVVASEKYIIIANNLKSIANRLNENCTLIEDLLFKIFDCRFLIVGISSDDWNIEKSKYISNIKNGVKYTEKKLSSESDDLNEINGKTSVDKLVELMGDNIIEYK